MQRTCPVQPIPAIYIWRLLGSNVGAKSKVGVDDAVEGYSMVAIVLGWPAVIASIILVLTGVIRGWSRMALVGAFLGCPFLLYLFASPRVGWLALIVGLLYVASSQAVAHSRKGLALVLATPFVAVAAVVARLVLRQ